MNKIQYKSKKGNIIEIIGAKSTGEGLNDVEYTIKINGKHTEHKLSYKQLKLLENGKL